MWNAADSAASRPRDSSGRNSPHLDLAFPCQGGMILNPYDGELDGRSRARLQTEAAGA